MTESFGTPEGFWKPRVWPPSSEASTALRGWIEHPGSPLYALDMDFRGADLMAADFTEAWLSGSNFSDVNLEHVILWGAHCEDAKFCRGNLRAVDLVKAHIDRADFSNACMVDANLRRVECAGAKFTNADMRNGIFGNASFMRSDMRGADLRSCSVTMTAFTDVNFVDAKVTGMTGTIIGSLTVRDGEGVVDLEGSYLEDWFRRNGAHVSVAPTVG